MNRHIAKLVLLLLLGAIINVAVAWVCASRASYKWIIGTLVDARPDGDLAFGLRGGWGSQEIEISAQTGGYFDDGEWTPKERLPDWIPSWSSVTSVSVKEMMQSGYWRLAETANGWPMLSLQWERRDHWFHTLTEPDQQLIINHGLSISPTQGRVLPLAPIWPGFAINTFIYAATVLLLFSFPGLVRQFRQRRRIKRGLCTRCAYPVIASGGTVCSECGAPVHRSRETAQ